MGVLFLVQQVGMPVLMRKCVRMRAAVMRVHDNVCVQMPVAQHQRIRQHKDRPGRHEGQSGYVIPGQRLPQQQKGQRRAHKRRRGVIGAGLCRAELLLGADVKENAQPIT